MEIDYRFVAPPSPCAYLPGRMARMEYVSASRIGPEEYLALMQKGWRRFGRNLFRPRCAGCKACQSLRIDVANFRPDRSQRRAWKANRDAVRLEITEPDASRQALDLHHRYHSAQAEAKGWPEHEDDASSYEDAFVDNPFATQEWRYSLGDDLVGVGYVDALPTALSGIYFFHDPDHRSRSLGTFNVLNLLDRAASLGLEYVYLGYFVDGCGSMGYKARFAPNQVLGEDGGWHAFRD